MGLGQNYHQLAVLKPQLLVILVLNGHTIAIPNLLSENRNIIGADLVSNASQDVWTGVQNGGEIRHQSRVVVHDVGVLEVHPVGTGVAAVVVELAPGQSMR
jgi:hypothetical protein